MSALLRIVLAAAIGLAFAAPAGAHPHVWVTMKSEVIYAADGTVTGIRHAWAFDDMYSTFATQGLPQKTPGVFTREELAPLADVNVSTLKESEYFTFAKADGKEIAFVDPRAGEYWLEYKDTVLTLTFVLPLKEPVKARALEVEIFDPSIFVDFAFAKDDPVSLAGAPAPCKLTVEKPKTLDTAQSKKLSEAFFNDAANSNFGAQFTNKVAVNCP